LKHVEEDEENEEEEEEDEDEDEEELLSVHQSWFNRV
jgi:hypothetical protein